MKKRLEEILEKVHAGKLTPAKALELLKDYPYCELDFAKVDHHREVAKGAPEIIFGLGKTPDQIVRISREILKKGSNLLVTRVEPAVWAEIRAKLPGAAYSEAARTVSLTKTAPPRRPRHDRRPDRRHVGYPGGRGSGRDRGGPGQRDRADLRRAASPASTASSARSTASGRPGSSSR